MVKKRKEKNKIVDVLSKKIPVWMGTSTSIVIHTVFFGGIFFLKFLNFDIDQIMLILTTAVSLEAIYLSLFIQMTVNKQAESLEDVEEDIDEIQKDVEGIEGDIDEIQEDVEGIEESGDDLTKSRVNSLNKVENVLDRLMKEISSLRQDIEIIKQKTIQEKNK